MSKPLVERPGGGLSFLLVLSMSLVVLFLEPRISGYFKHKYGLGHWLYSPVFFDLFDGVGIISFIILLLSNVALLSLANLLIPKVQVKSLLTATLFSPLALIFGTIAFFYFLISAFDGSNPSVGTGLLMTFLTVLLFFVVTTKVISLIPNSTASRLEHGLTLLGSLAVITALLFI